MSTVSQLENSAQSGSVYETQESQKTHKKAENYGRTIGQPKLSDEAKEYYEELKKKYSNMDFILVSKDMKDVAKSQAGSYANPNKLVVLIDEEKIERMATDENFRKQYEAIISNAAAGLSQFKAQLGSKASVVKSYGMQVNDGGNASFFAVVDKSLAAQRERIAKQKVKKSAEKKAAEKKADRKAAEEKRAEKNAGKVKEDEDTVTVTASSVEELLQKINDIIYEEMSNSVETEEEKLLGQYIDFKG
ncbi:MAG: hypothetical protein J6C64_03315 [Lachnospiraceae bacterium]|nr:hypothetical protein [Lachnospiraceae bacterium]